MGYVYGPEASNADVAGRSLLPLLRKFVDGYNVAVMAFGATGACRSGGREGRCGREGAGETDVGVGVTGAVPKRKGHATKRVGVSVGMGRGR